MGATADNLWGSNEYFKSNLRLTDNLNKPTFKEKCKNVFKLIKYIWYEITVEPCVFIYMMCIAMSALAVQNMHLEKSCRVNYNYSDDICDRIRDRNTTGLDVELNNVQSLVAKVIAWKFPLQTGIPAAMVLFIGAWSDKTKRRKICMLVPMIGEIVTNVGLLFATYYFKELSLGATALIEALPPAFTGCYLILFMGMYSFLTDRTTTDNRTFRLGIANIFANVGTSVGTALSGVMLSAIGYYGMFSLILFLHIISFVYGIFKLEDIVGDKDESGKDGLESKSLCQKVTEVFKLVVDTVMVVLRPRVSKGRTQVFIILVLYLLMVGPLYGDSQVSYLYAIRKFGFTVVEYSLYGTINIVLGLAGTFFCISVLSKALHVDDSIVGSLAAVSRIVACFVFALSPNKQWFYSAPVFNLFSHTGLTAIRSIGTKSVSPEEVAKLSSLMGVMEAIAPSIYMPTSSYIYVSTIETFPGAFYMFDAALTIVALGLFATIYILVRWRNVVLEIPNTKEHLARSNEISRF